MINAMILVVPDVFLVSHRYLHAHCWSQSHSNYCGCIAPLSFHDLCHPLYSLSSFMQKNSLTSHDVDIPPRTPVACILCRSSASSGLRWPQFSSPSSASHGHGIIGKSSEKYGIFLNPRQTQRIPGLCITGWYGSYVSLKIEVSNSFKPPKWMVHWWKIWKTEVFTNKHGRLNETLHVDQQAGW